MGSYTALDNRNTEPAEKSCIKLDKKGTEELETEAQAHTLELELVVKSSTFCFSRSITQDTFHRCVE